MNKSIIQTSEAPAAIGTYSQAVRVDHTVYMSGQIGLDPASMQLVDGVDAQIHQVFKNLAAVASAAGGSGSAAKRSCQLWLCESPPVAMYGSIPRLSNASMLA